MELRPKNIMIVGGGSGIGLAAAQELFANGAKKIILASRNTNKLSKAKDTLRISEKQKVYTAAFDISDVDSHDNALKNVCKLVEENIDGLVISSGINFDGGNWKGLNISSQDWDKVMNINLKGVFFLIRNFANMLHANRLKGNICVVSSISAHRDMLSVYQISKAAVSGIVHAYGKHLCERGIVLNCVEPGTINTDMMPHLADYTDGIRSGKEWGDNSIRRLIRADEIAKIICFLMSDLGEVMSGTCLLAGGGCKGLHY